MRADMRQTWDEMHRALRVALTKFVAKKREREPEPPFADWFKKEIYPALAANVQQYFPATPLEIVAHEMLLVWWAVDEARPVEDRLRELQPRAKRALKKAKH